MGHLENLVSTSRVANCHVGVMTVTCFAPETQEGHARAIKPAQTKLLQHSDEHPKRLLFIVVHLQQASAHEVHALQEKNGVDPTHHPRFDRHEKRDARGGSSVALEVSFGFTQCGLQG